MTLAEIQAVMRQAGWPESLIVKGAAIAYYESAHGNPRAGKVDSLESSYGLFQINLGRPGTALQRERASWGPPSRLYDPLYNARLAYQIYKSQGWNAWRTTAILYPSRYQQYMAASQAAYNGGSGNSASVQTVLQPQTANSNSLPESFASEQPETDLTPVLIVGALGIVLYLLL